MIKKYAVGIVTTPKALFSLSTTVAQFRPEGRCRPKFELRNGYKSQIAENRKLSGMILNLTLQHTVLSFKLLS